MHSEAGIQVGFEHHFPVRHKLYFYSLPQHFHNSTKAFVEGLEIA